MMRGVSGTLLWLIHICQREGAEHSEREALDYNGGMQLSPQRGQWAEGSPLELQAFCPFSYKRGAKIKDLRDSPPSCPKQTAYRSPFFWLMGSCRDGPPVPGSVRPCCFVTDVVERCELLDYNVV